MLSRMLRRAQEYIPGLARLHALRAWTGFRAATPDGQPLIGPWPGHDGLLLATGHEGLGITTAFGTARLIADLVLERASPIPREPYLPARLRGSVP
jgi:glycine/D-amino acid oxidase-like deaminating enzyme